MKVWQELKKIIKYGFINKKGKIVIEPSFDGAEDFHENLAKIFNKR
jgi:hypothetical protein